jgi:transposase InsO family protein
VEVDAKYIKGMINNPDLQPNATINRWIAGILLFQFKLVHVSAAKHAGVDGLSRRPPVDEDPDEDDDHEDWLDRSYSFGIALLNERTHLVEAATTSLTRHPHYVPCAMRLTRLPDYHVLLDVAEHTAEEPPIPRSKSANALDERLVATKLFLSTRKRPANLTEDEFKAFVTHAARFFVLEDNLWRREAQGRHQLVVKPHKRYRILKEAHDDLGHKGVYAVRTRLLLRFWWPYIIDDIKWYARTCHECQVRQTRKLHIPPIVPIPGGLFRRAHIDTMKMPKAGGFEYLVQARCALTSYPEWRMMRKENTKTLTAFIFEELLCRWGPITELITDNAPAYRLAADSLAEKYGIHPIRISPYNSQANGIVERRHLDVREAIMKSCDGDETRWYTVVHSVFWAERVTVHKATGLSPYFMVHGVEPIFPFDLAEATFLAPLPERGAFNTTDLVAWRARQLQKRLEDLNAIKDKVVRARYKSIRDFEQRFRMTIKNYDFAPGALVLVRNSRVEYELSKKTKPRYLGPMIVVRRTKGGSYLLAELDGAVSKLRYAAFRIIPYYPRSEERVTVTSITGLNEESLDRLAEENIPEPDDEDPELALDE